MKNRLPFKAIASLACSVICGTTMGPAAFAVCTASQGFVPSISLQSGEIASMHWDPILQQTWRTVVSCDHPERPATATLLPKQDRSSAKESEQSLISRTAPTVRVGDKVRLWRQDDRMRIEVAGIAMESGAKGAIVHVRLIAPSTGETERLTGIVRGPDDVEMQF